MILICRKSVLAGAIMGLPCGKSGGAGGLSASGVNAADAISVGLGRECP